MKLFNELLRLSDAFTRGSLADTRTQENVLSLSLSLFLFV